jgi:type II pantothenate kinase
VQAQDPITSLYGALGNFLFSNSLELGDVSKVVLTGVGSSFVDGNIYGIPTEKVEEFTAVGVGGLALSGEERAVVVSMGTGTAFIWADSESGEMSHMGGSGVGGGTIAGLCKLLCGTNRVSLIRKLTGEGDINKIDLNVGDITKGGYSTLAADITAANFGNLSDDANASDLAVGVVNMVFQSIGTSSVFACRSKGCNTVVLTGYISILEQCRPCFDLFTRLHGIEFIIPENAPYATCIGAALSSFQ